MGISTSITLKLKDPSEAIQLFGKNDENLKHLRSRLGATLIARGGELKISGEARDVKEAERTFRSLLTSLRRGDPITLTEIEHTELNGIAENAARKPKNGDHSDYLPRRARPKTDGQRQYVNKIMDSEITFGIGPAGTGKTYLAVAMAVQFLKDKKVKRIILTRPAVEAGEKLGFLPGDLQAKIDPYLRPLYDALYDMMDDKRMDDYAENGIIEVAPLAFMRGRTLNDAFIILDEAQNTTPEQMKMFLTRMGFNSRVVVTGDITQTDLPNHMKSGLSVAESLLKDIKGIDFLYFSEADVVRHPLVAKIVKAYDQFKG